jgi:hypothetical protein
LDNTTAGIQNESGGQSIELDIGKLSMVKIRFLKEFIVSKELLKKENGE